MRGFACRQHAAARVPSRRCRQGGSSLIDALASLVVFSFGMVGLAHLNTSALEQAGHSQLRAQASYLTEELVGLASADLANVSCYQMDAAGPGSCTSTIAQAAVEDWRARVLALPGAGETPPTVDYLADGTFTVTISWRRPQETMLHRHVATTNLYPS